MKTYFKSLLLPAAMAVFTACGPSAQQDEELITVDVSKSYPKKELILQDFMDVEYIPLETTAEFITLGYLQAIGKDLMIVRNKMAADGNIFLYDRKGKAVRKINRRGQGNGEYTATNGIILDEENGELFVGNMQKGSVLAYDLSGNFKRSFAFKEGGKEAFKSWVYYRPIYTFDRDHFICQDASNARNYNGADEDLEPRNLFLIVSKQDGTVKEEIKIPFEKKVSQVLFADKGIGIVNNPCIVPYQGEWLLTEPSADTIYTYSSARGLRPFIVRTPSIQSMSQEIFLFPGVITDRYCFLQAVEKELNEAMMDTYYRLMRKDLVYDREEGEVFEPVVYNGDFTDKKPIANLVDEIFDLTVFNNEEIAFAWRIEAPEIIEAYEAGKLKGKLKEIAAGMHEEDNPVLMLAKYKQH